MMRKVKEFLSVFFLFSSLMLFFSRLLYALPAGAGVYTPLSVHYVNQPPTAVADGGPDFATDEDTPFTITSVLTNDSDPNLDSLSLLSVNISSTLGLVTDNGDGTFGYDPNGSFEALNPGETATDTLPTPSATVTAAQTPPS